MGISVNYNLQLDVTAQLATGEDNVQSAASQTYTISGNNGQLSGTSTVPASKYWTDNRTLAGSSETLDLTSLTGPYASSVTFNGLRIQCIKIVAGSANVADIIVDIGDTNPYHIFGDANAQVTLKAGAALEMVVPNNGQVVGSSNKNVKVSGTTGDSYNIMLVAG